MLKARYFYQQKNQQAFKVELVHLTAFDIR